MTYESMMVFAQAWVANWNRRDIAGVLAHFAEDAEFVSPAAAKYAGHPVVRGKRALSDYWHAALDNIAVLEFTLDHAAWDERRRELNVVYIANLNGDRKRACEVMTFNEQGEQIRGEALYGASI